MRPKYSEEEPPFVNRRFNASRSGRWKRKRVRELKAGNIRESKKKRKNNINTVEDKTVNYEKKSEGRAGQERVAAAVGIKEREQRSAPHNHHDAGTKGVPVRHPLLGQPLS